MAREDVLLTLLRRAPGPLAIASLALSIALTAGSAAAEAPKRKPTPPPETCLEHILAAERDLGIPDGLLLSVALTESGRGGAPHNYALNIQGRAIFPASEREAATLLRDDQGKLRRNAFAGCMQLSVAHHSAKFQPVERIVNPGANVRYAADYLMRLKRDTGSWTGAVARYNGGTGTKRTAYLCRVQRHMVGLGAPQSGVIEAGACPGGAAVEVAPKTRRAFQIAAGLPLS